MNEEQARFVRKLKVDQNCSYPTVARQYYNKYDSTSICNTKDAERVMYFDLTEDDPKIKTHMFTESDKDIPATEYKVVEYIFSPDIGIKLCLEARQILKDEIGDDWNDFADQTQYQSV